MKYTIYEHPTTHQFAHRPLPSRYLAGDPLPAVVTDRWFESHDTAVAALAELLDRDEAEDTTAADAAAQTNTAGAQSIEPAPRPTVWFQH